MSTFDPLPGSDPQPAAFPVAPAPYRSDADVVTAQLVPGSYDGVLAEIERLQQQKPGWGNALVILAFSLVFFFGVTSARGSWGFALLLIPILLFHELGHLLAMRAFGYRNLRMFFIPFFGAAVTGRHYNVAGWQKAVVSLMGPMPGILVAAVLGVVALVTREQLLMDAVLLTLLLNGFNLLPFLPLDGGWVMHALFFSRHYWLDTGFRLAAALGLIGLGLVFGHILTALGVLALLGLPAQHRLARLVYALQQRGLPPASPDGQTIPPATAGTIIDQLRATLGPRLNDRMAAAFTVRIFEGLNARPPDLLATVLLSGVYFGGLFAVLFLGVSLLVGWSIPQ